MPLCNRPECTHSDSSCTAYALIDGVSVPVFAVIGNRLFVVQTEAETDTPPRIIVAGLDGSSPETLVELDASVSIALSFIQMVLIYTHLSPSILSRLHIWSFTGLIFRKGILKVCASSRKAQMDKFPLASTNL